MVLRCWKEFFVLLVLESIFFTSTNYDDTQLWRETICFTFFSFFFFVCQKLRYTFQSVVFEHKTSASTFEMVVLPSAVKRTILFRTNGWKKVVTSRLCAKIILIALNVGIFINISLLWHFTNTFYWHNNHLCCLCNFIGYSECFCFKYVTNPWMILKMYIHFLGMKFTKKNERKQRQ